MICKTLNGLVEMASADFDGEVDFDSAKSLCSGLGDDWRLPKRLELQYLKETHDTLFKDACYWSSEGSYVCFFPLEHSKAPVSDNIGYTNFARSVRSV